MVILDNKGVFYLASRCKGVHDALSDLPWIRGIIYFFVRNGILANSLPLFSQAHHLTTRELQQQLPLFDSYSL